MTKEVYIALIQKDIRELDLLAQGLYETETAAPTLVKLASAKAQEVIDNLQILAAYSPQQSTVSLKEEETPVKVDIPKEALVEASPEPTILELVENSKPEEEAPVEVVEEKPLQVEAPKAEEVIIEQTTLVGVNKVPEKVNTKINTQTESKIDALGKTKDTSLASSLSNRKITDIKQAISIADRFRFQRELFQNNGEKMNETLTILNNCKSIEEAENNLASLGWNSESETVIDFMVIVNRLFV